jgi:2-polyprenyl-6-methoxyphenol hydroxylase-like FAD-dependent oxidoreductase
VGLSLAIGLSQKKGKNITIYEKRAVIKASVGRMTSLFLHYRAIKAFCNLGIDITKIKGSVPTNRMIHVQGMKAMEAPFEFLKNEQILYILDR